MLTDGSADATFLGGAVPTASITQAAASMELTFIPFGEEEKQRLIRRLHVFFRPATIPAETYRGQTEPFDGLDVGSMHVITAADAPDDLVYNATKLLYENPLAGGGEARRGPRHQPEQRGARHGHRVPSRRDPLLRGSRHLAAVAARVNTPTAFDRPCIPPELRCSSLTYGRICSLLAPCQPGA